MEPSAKDAMKSQLRGMGGKIKPRGEPPPGIIREVERVVTVKETVEVVTEKPSVIDEATRARIAALELSIQQTDEALRYALEPGEAEPVQEEPAPEPEPEHHFADLMLADETIDDARARLSQRLKELRHYLIAPEIRVNDDGSLGLTAGEQSELQDLERRQTLGRWLDA